MKKYGLVFLYSCMATVSSGIASFAVTLKWFSVSEMLRSMTADLVLFAVLLLLPSKLAFAAMLILFIPLVALTLMNVLHIAIYNSGVSAFSVMSSLETSGNEASEFLSEFMTAPNVLLTAVIILGALFLLAGAIKSNARIARGKRTALASIVLICVCGYFIQAKGERLLNSHGGFVIVKSCINYQRDLHFINSLKSARESQNYAGVTLLDNRPEDAKTYIFIIGESSNRNHMSLYGYHRDTNPKLREQAPKLNIFTDVISSSTHTIPSLRRALFFHNDLPDDSALILNSHSIIGLLSRAGFETWWLSNQTANADGLTGTSVFARDAKHSVFFNKSRTEGHSVSYDEVLLKELEKVLQRNTPRKAIFVHLLGSHLSYHLRYPKEFSHFTSYDDLDDGPYRGQAEKAYVNQYDNSIRYTDHIVSRIIDLAGQRDDAGFVLYFSDHGQEVYDSLPIRGQDAKRPTRNMFEVPFILWMSEAYTKTNPQVAAMAAGRLNTPFSLYRFADTAAELARVGFDGCNPSQSLFSPHYDIPVQRNITYGRTYDSLPELKSNKLAEAQAAPDGLH